MMFLTKIVKWVKTWIYCIETYQKTFHILTYFRINSLLIWMIFSYLFEINIVGRTCWKQSHLASNCSNLIIFNIHQKLMHRFRWNYWFGYLANNLINGTLHLIHSLTFIHIAYCMESMLSELEIWEMEGLIKKCIKNWIMDNEILNNILCLCFKWRVKNTYILPSRFAGSVFMISFLIIVRPVFR